jgi:HSP20 family protein
MSFLYGFWVEKMTKFHHYRFGIRIEKCSMFLKNMFNLKKISNMTLVRSNTGLIPSLLEDLFESDFFKKPTMMQAGLTVPAVNIKETPEQYVIEMAAAGMKKEDFQINLERNVIIISSDASTSLSTSSTDKKDSENYTRKEFNYSSFSRSFVLPEAANREDINATYVDGVLIVVIPKKDEAKMLPKSIQVS